MPFADSLPDRAGMLEDDYQELIMRIEKTYREKKDEWVSARRDMEDYYATWVHQIKAPIAVMKVMLQQEDTKENRELQAELSGSNSMWRWRCTMSGWVKGLPTL